MESKYNLLTRLLKNIKNVVNPDGSLAGGTMIVHEVEQRGETFLEGTLPNVDGYEFGTNDGTQIYNYVKVSVDLDGVNLESVVVDIGNRTYGSLMYANGTLTISVGNISESELQGLNITVYTVLTALDKTYKEIADAGFAVLHTDDNGTAVNTLSGFGFFLDGSYVIAFNDGGTYHAETENDYPVLARVSP